jgi:hypothetical protein
MRTKPTSPPGSAHPNETPDAADPAREQKQEANQLLVGGAAIGAMGIAGTALLGATCPVCWIAAPTLLGAGAIKHWRCRRAERAQSGDEADDETPSRD